MMIEGNSGMKGVEEGADGEGICVGCVGRSLIGFDVGVGCGKSVGGDVIVVCVWLIV